ncbi:MAG TPA: hypothetical protein VN032_09195 [Thermoanaerobaculia bacterium]|nr:hypothetical protein [Thermoanaerobaculia bacterium]
MQFNPGLPLMLSLLFRIFPGGIAGVARVATATATGLVPVLPFLLWRPVLAFRWRFLAGLLLAVWPGQVFFSGVTAQENWVLLPTVALAALAVRRLRDPADEGHPIVAGLLLCAAAAIRQEMLVAMSVPALAAAGFPGRGPGRTTRLLRFAAAAAIPLALLAAERRAATGRFSITTEHGGLTVLGTLVPGSAAAGWLDPTLYVASIEPALLKEPARLRSAAWGLAADEARRRYRFHALRVATALLRLSVESDAQNLFWSLEAPGALSPDKAPAGAAWARAARPLLRIELALISGFFLVAFLQGIRRRDSAVLVLAFAVVLKTSLQVAFSPLGRLMVPAIALELLVIALTAADLAGPAAGRERVAVLLLSVLASVVLLASLPPLERLAIRKDEPPPRIARFPLAIAGGGGWVECAVESGRLTAIAGDRAWIGSTDAAARVACRLPELRPGATLGLDLEAPAVPGGRDPGAGFERVEADGQERYRLDAGSEAAGSWRRIPLASATEPPPRTVAVETRGATAGFGFVRRVPGAPALPRDRTLP